MIIDAHIHLYPPSVYKDPTAWAQSRSEPYWLECVLPPSGPRLQGWVSVSQLLRDMDEANIEKVIILGWYWETHQTCVENLSWQLDWIQQHPDRLIAFAAFNPNGGKDAIELLKRGFDRGISGIGELNPPAQGYDYEDEILHEALEWAGNQGLPVNFHVTDPLSRNYPGKIETPIASLIALARRHRRTNFVFAHLAGMMNLPQLKSLPNVYLDTAATPLLYENTIYHQAIDQFGSDRILFGTDYPLRIVPKEQVRPNFTAPLAFISDANLPSDALNKILGQNVMHNLIPTLQS